MLPSRSIPKSPVIKIVLKDFHSQLHFVSTILNEDKNYYFTGVRVRANVMLTYTKYTNVGKTVQHFLKLFDNGKLFFFLELM